jgi:hypothetical protein
MTIKKVVILTLSYCHSDPALDAGEESFGESREESPRSILR